ncbi:MAG: BcpO-related WXXGXW repeat protein [Planctomycetes bacterium]|nr:BcpO-related WXXGXW repeat protein [Planctomycetota bacterium]
MILHRSTMFSSTGLALAALLVLSTSSCVFSQRSRPGHALAVKAEAEPTHARADGARSASHELDYFEGDAAPEVPAALPEQRPSAPSSSHVWIAGQHSRRDSQWVWVGGHYALPPRKDVVWVPGHWVGHLHGYAWISGAWR